MPNPGLTEEQMREAVDAYLAHGRVVSHAARSLNHMDRKTFSNRLKRAAEAGMLPTDPVMPGFKIAKVSTTQDADGNVQKTHIQQKPEPGDAFQMPEGHRIKGVSALLDSEGRVVQQWTKTTEGLLSHEEIVKAVGSALREYKAEHAPIAPPTGIEEDLLTVYPLVDWHVGLLAWAEECGENYDLAIARDVILKSMARLVGSSPRSKECVILGLGDLLHFDGYEPVTARSRNFLDADGRYPKVLKTATQMVIATIDLALQRHDTVRVRILAGNHDDQSAVAVGLALLLHYEGHERVIVDDSPSRFWWFRFGKVFLGATHGDKAKMKDLPLVMAYDRPEDWAASTLRRIYTGHIHHQSEIEEGGVVVSSMRSPVAKDAYHSFEKYRSGRSVYSTTFRKDGTWAAGMEFNL